MHDGTARNYAGSASYCISQGGRLASIHNDAENEAITNLVKRTAYIGAESDGKGKWKWADGTTWWQPASGKTDGITGTSETRIAIKTDKKWHDWETGGANLGVVCAKGRVAVTTVKRAATTAGCTSLVAYYNVVK